MFVLLGSRDLPGGLQCFGVFCDDNLDMLMMNSVSFPRVREAITFNNKGDSIE